MRTTLALIVALAMATPVAFVGCDRTVSETTRTSTSSDGDMKRESKTVTKDAEGDTKVIERKEVIDR